MRNPKTRAAVIAEAIGVLGERTDNNAVIGWSEVIDALREEHDRRLADAVAALRAMNRYDSALWARAAIRAIGYLEYW